MRATADGSVPTIGEGLVDDQPPLMNCGINLIDLCDTKFGINPLWPSDATWHHVSGSILAQVMACCLTGNNPLPEPMLTHHQ